jgi:hypothetical protein
MCQNKKPLRFADGSGYLGQLNFAGTVIPKQLLLLNQTNQRYAINV